MTHICVSKLTIIISDNGLVPGWFVNRTNFNAILIKIHTLLYKKIHLKIYSGKRRKFCLGFKLLRVLRLHKISNRNTRNTKKHDAKWNLKLNHSKCRPFACLKGRSNVPNEKWTITTICNIYNGPVLEIIIPCTIARYSKKTWFMCLIVYVWAVLDKQVFRT